MKQSLADNCLGGGGEGTKEICKMLTLNRNLRKINLSGIGNIHMSVSNYYLQEINSTNLMLLN